MTEIKEPQIHSHITDVLPEGHPLANETVICKYCDEMLHASNNECMTTWIETGKGNYCLSCFFSLTKDEVVIGILGNQWGLG